MARDWPNYRRSQERSREPWGVPETSNAKVAFVDTGPKEAHKMNQSRGKWANMRHWRKKRREQSFKLKIHRAVLF